LLEFFLLTKKIHHRPFSSLLSFFFFFFPSSPLRGPLAASRWGFFFIREKGAYRRRPAFHIFPPLFPSFFFFSCMPCDSSRGPARVSGEGVIENPSVAGPAVFFPLPLFFFFSLSFFFLLSLPYMPLSAMPFPMKKCQDATPPFPFFFFFFFPPLLFFFSRRSPRSFSPDEGNGIESLHGCVFPFFLFVFLYGRVIKGWRSSLLRSRL